MADTKKPYQPGAIELQIVAEARRQGIDPRLALAMASQESKYDPRATSEAGAKGVFQLMDKTAASLGVKDPYNADQSIRGGVSYLKKMLDRHDGNVDLALASYNAGPGNVRKYKGIPPFKETQEYVKKIQARVADQEFGRFAQPEPPPQVNAPPAAQDWVESLLPEWMQSKAVAEPAPDQASDARALSMVLSPKNKTIRTGT